MSAGEAVDRLFEGARSDDLQGATNVLVVAPSLADDVRAAFYRQLLPADPATVDVLAVDYGQRADAYLAEWERYVGERPRQCGIVCVNASAGGAGTDDLGPGAVARVESPTDLTGIGIRVSDYLERHGGPDTVVTFDSVTMLLQYADLQRAYRFLDVVTKRVRRVDAVAYYTIDPNAHEYEDLATLASLFDAVAGYDDGSWETHRR